MSPAALRRAVAQGNGWYGFFLDVDNTKKMVEGLRETAKRVERPASLGRLEITVTPPGPVDADTAKRYEDLGVDRLVLMRGFGDMAGQRAQSAEDAVIAFLDEMARAHRIS